MALTDAQGALRGYKIKDPSLHNWLALALAVRGEGISDFPICNKSFNLSYCGHDPVKNTLMILPKISSSGAATDGNISPIWTRSV